MSILICKIHPDETRREGCFSFYSPPFLIWWPAPQWLLPKRSSCSCRNLREREREGGKVGKVTDRRAQDPALEARYFESHSASTMCQLTIQNKLFNPPPYCFPHVLPWKIGIALALASTSWGAAEDKTDWVLGSTWNSPAYIKYSVITADHITESLRIMLSEIWQPWSCSLMYLLILRDSDNLYCCQYVTVDLPSVSPLGVLCVTLLCQDSSSKWLYL